MASWADRTGVGEGGGFAGMIAGMKYVVLVPDGCADEPIDELGGRTPLEAARMPPCSRRWPRRGEVGRAAVIPPGLPPGSDVGNMSILGYDPAAYHTGRAPDRGRGAGRRARGPDQVAYRCNLVTVGDDGTMVDFAAGHPTTERAAPIVAALDAELGGGATACEFHPGVEYRHLWWRPADWADADCVPPHDLTGKPAVWPTGPAAAEAAGAHGRVRGRRRPASGLGRQPDLALGPGLPARRCPRFADALRRRRPRSAPRSTSCAGSACSPTSTSSTSPARPPASTPTTPRQRERALDALADARPLPAPRRGHRRGRPRRRRRREGRARSSAGTPRSSAAWSPGLDGWGRSGCCCCPTTPRRARADPHRRPGAVPARRLRRRRARWHYTEPGVAGPPGGAGPRADGPALSDLRPAVTGGAGCRPGGHYMTASAYGGCSTAGPGVGLVVRWPDDLARSVLSRTVPSGPPAALAGRGLHAPGQRIVRSVAIPCPMTVPESHRVDAPGPRPPTAPVAPVRPS